MSLLLLNKNGFDVGKYISFEEQINQRSWPVCGANSLSGDEH